MRVLVWLMLALLALSGCRMPSGPTTGGLVPELAGEVRFAGRQVQASMTDIATAATVSLINVQTNQTEAATVTDASGSFVLRFSTSFQPSGSTLYYLEAVKGLNSNRPGYAAARVRTVAKYQDGWTTLTNATPNAGIVLNRATTAVAVGAALKAGTASPVAFDSLIGTVTPGSPGTFAGVTNLSTTDFDSLVTLVTDLLTDDRDPVGGILLTLPATWERSAGGTTLVVSGLSVATGSTGTAVTLSGMGFDPTPANNTVRFNGTPAVVSSATANSLVTSVPLGATTGTVTVQVGNLTAQGPVFSVSGIIPGGISAGN